MPSTRTLIVCSLAATVILTAPALLHAAEPARPLLRSARSGAWSAQTTWEGGRIPNAGDRVQVRAGHTVVYDVSSDRVLRSLHVAGTLTFARRRDTRLDVGLLKIQPGDDASENGFDCDAHIKPPAPGQPLPALEVGTPDHPIEAGHTALIRLTYVAGMDKESCPAIVCCGGRMDFHGAPLSRAWVKLKATAKKGDTVVTLAEPVAGWRAGDHLIVTATRLTRDDGRGGMSTEERTLRAVDGARLTPPVGPRSPDRGLLGHGQETVPQQPQQGGAVDGARLTLDKALDLEHQGLGDYRGEVANLSRNVVVESADPRGERGHTMYHRHSAGSISYAEFRHLGKKGVLGRYSLHYHLVGNTMRGSSVVGASIWDSHNRWLTIHGTNYLVVRDCVGYQSVGHGFFLEDGTEIYNVLDRCLAVQALRGKPLPHQALPFDRNEGAGFWWANSLNSFTGNVSCENNRYGYRFEATRGSAFNPSLPIQRPDGTRRPTDIRTLPFVRFEDNEAHCDGLYGLNLGEGVARVGPDERHPFVIKHMKIWEIHYAFRPQSPCVLVEDMRIHRAAYGIYHPNYDRHVYKNLLISETNTEPFNRGHDDDSVQYGVLAVDGLTFAGFHNGYVPLIQISDDNPTGIAESHFRNVKVLDRRDGKRRALVNLGGGPRPAPKTPKGVPIYLHDYYGPNRHAKIVSTKAKDLLGDGNKYHTDAPLTGDESRVAEVHDVVFPRVLDAIDDLPPATVITRVSRSKDGKATVRGCTSDNGTVTKVLVNGRPARALSANFAEWEIVLDKVPGGALKLSAHAEDAAGNVEKLAHEVAVGDVRNRGVTDRH